MGSASATWASSGGRGSCWGPCPRHRTCAGSPCAHPPRCGSRGGALRPWLGGWKEDSSGIAAWDCSRPGSGDQESAARPSGRGLRAAARSGSPPWRSFPAAAPPASPSSCPGRGAGGGSRARYSSVRALRGGPGPLRGALEKRGLESRRVSSRVSPGNRVGGTTAAAGRAAMPSASGSRPRRSCRRGGDSGRAGTRSRDGAGTGPCPAGSGSSSSRPSAPGGARSASGCGDERRGRPAGATTWAGKARARRCGWTRRSPCRDAGRCGSGRRAVGSRGRALGKATSSNSVAAPADSASPGATAGVAAEPRGGSFSPRGRRRGCSAR